MRTRYRSSARRPAFTIVELMVAAAVCMLIMAILATVFQMGLDTMRQMRSQADMADQLRAAEAVIRRDLQAPHFPPIDSAPGVLNRGMRLSDYQFDVAGTTRPQGGFFRIISQGNTVEGSDQYGISSSRAGPGHLLHFSSILPGGADQNTYSASVNNNTYRTAAAEIAYFLDPTLVYADPGNQVRLNNLIRRQRLVFGSTTDTSKVPASDLDPAVLSIGTNGLNLLGNLTDSTNRLGGATATPPSLPGTVSDTGLNAMASRLGDDILLSNVISFEVQVLWTTGGTNTPGATSFSSNTDYPFGLLNGEFDTRNNPPQPSVGNIRVRALQIRVRVWDAKMGNARQLTIVQDL